MMTRIGKYVFLHNQVLKSLHQVCLAKKLVEIDLLLNLATYILQLAKIAGKLFTSPHLLFDSSFTIFRLVCTPPDFRAKEMQFRGRVNDKPYGDGTASGTLN